MPGWLLNETHIILGWILSMLFSGCKARRLRSIPIPSIVTLTEFFHADIEKNIHQLPVSWYLSACLLS